MSATLIRYRDAATTSNFVYLRGEPIYDSNTGEFAVGDGATTWSALPKFEIGGGGGGALSIDGGTASSTYTTTIDGGGA